MSYLDRLKGLDGIYSPMEATAKTEKIDLRGFCSFPIEQIRSISAEAEPAGEDTVSGVSWRWWLHFADREPMEVAFSPEATHGEVLDFYPDALAAEPADEVRRQPDTMLTSAQEAAIRDCLAQIGEFDEAIVGVVLAQCRHDADARQYFLGRAASVPEPTQRNVADVTNVRTWPGGDAKRRRHD